MKNLLTLGVIVVAATLGASQASAGDVHPGVIFGTGNANGNFTTSTGGGVEIGLRAKIPFAGTTNYDGGNTYTYAAGQVWNFDWSINTDVAGTTGNNLTAFTYALSMFKVNADGTNPADALTFDLINAGLFDHSIGDNSTTAATDSIAGDLPTYAALISNNNVAQNSWRYDFFNFPTTAIENYDVNVLGSYIVRLTAFDGLTEVSTVDITVNIVPLPSAVFAGLGMLGAFAGVRTIRRR